MDSLAKWEERNWIILSLIRFHSMVNLEESSVYRLLGIARELRSVEEAGGSVSDDVLLQEFMEGL